MSKTSHSQPQQRSSRQPIEYVQHVQPWLRDRYVALREGTGPRWEQTRAVVVPVITDTSHKVRDELVPAAAHLSARVAEEALHRSAPLRAEVTDRATATLAAARGQLTAKQLGQLKRRQNGHNRRKLWLIGGAAAAGAALSTAAVLWQRSRYQAWVEDEAVHNALDDTPDHTPEPLTPDNPNHTPPTDHDPTEHASNSARHRDETP